MGYIICTVVFILVIIVTIIVLAKNKKTPFTNKSIHEDLESKVKTLKYFGCNECPYSNTNSNAYKVVTEFATLKKDVNVEYYWTDKNQREMEQYKIMYVPTIIGLDNNPIELKLPDDYNKNGKSNIELKQALMDHIYTLL